MVIVDVATVHSATMWKEQFLLIYLMIEHTKLNM